MSKVFEAILRMNQQNKKYINPASYYQKSV